MATATPTQNPFLDLSLKNIIAPRPTHIGARLANNVGKVAFDNTTPDAQRAISKPKHAPANTASLTPLIFSGLAGLIRLTINGIDKITAPIVMRYQAVTIPGAFADLMNIAENPISITPANKDNTAFDLWFSLLIILIMKKFIAKIVHLRICRSDNYHSSQIFVLLLISVSEFIRKL